MFLRPYIFIIAMLTLSSCAGTQEFRTPQAVSIGHPEQYFVHIVQPSETIWHIAQLYGVSSEQVLKTNNLTNPAVLKHNQSILIPKNIIRTSSKNKGFIMPAKGKIISWFNQEKNGVKNKGIDILTEEGSDVVASQSGKVSFIGELPGYGKTVIIAHEDNDASVYCGLSNIQIKTSDKIEKNKKIAVTKKTILHFQIRNKHKIEDPCLYLN